MYHEGRVVLTRERPTFGNDEKWIYLKEKKWQTLFVSPEHISLGSQLPSGVESVVFASTARMKNFPCLISYKIDTIVTQIRKNFFANFQLSSHFLFFLANSALILLSAALSLNLSLIKLLFVVDLCVSRRFRPLAQFAQQIITILIEINYSWFLLLPHILTD